MAIKDPKPHQDEDVEAPSGYWDDPEIDQAIMAEVKRRYHKIEDGQAEFLDGEEVFAELFSEFP